MKSVVSYGADLVVSIIQLVLGASVALFILAVVVSTVFSLVTNPLPILYFLGANVVFVTVIWLIYMKWIK